MCGIAGGIAFTEQGKQHLANIDEAVKALAHRGPDGSGIFRDGNVVLGHTRLAIIDCSEIAAQPFTSNSGRHTIVFNGEIFNYRELRAELEKEGVQFRSHSDTEVLLELFAKYGKDCLEKLNGFFAFAIHDKQEQTLFLARDRYGEKPLYYHSDREVFVFGSELKAVLAFGIPKDLSPAQLGIYLHLNYIPGHDSILSGVKKANKGFHYVVDPAGENSVIGKSWYHIPYPATGEVLPYDEAKQKLFDRCEEAVKRRLVADVPLGAFLSGGLDSSIITALAVRHKKDLETFSIGFADEPYFDETKYAEMVAKHLGTRHHVFSLRNSDLLEGLYSFFETIDEPFADSSALAVNLLSKKTRAFVTVALSGDGADELFGGYNKHEAELMVRQRNLKTALVKNAGFIWDILPASRNSAGGNKIRQLRKFSQGMKLSAAERYWRWAGFTEQGEIDQLLVKTFHNRDLLHERFTFGMRDTDDFNRILANDMNMVLEGDMLVKVDRMSMLHGLEVRPPFLDHEVVDFVMPLPASYKIEPGNRKKILKDTFAHLLPQEILTRKKQGFEVPLLHWFRNELSGMIEELLNEKFLREQNLFNPVAVQTLRKQLHSSNPGDSAARIWGLIVFQKWWLKYMRS